MLTTEGDFSGKPLLSHMFKALLWRLCFRARICSQNVPYKWSLQVDDHMVFTSHTVCRNPSETSSFLLFSLVQENNF